MKRLKEKFSLKYPPTKASYEGENQHQWARLFQTTGDQPLNTTPRGWLQGREEGKGLIYLAQFLAGTVFHQRKDIAVILMIHTKQDTRSSVSQRIFPRMLQYFPSSNLGTIKHPNST